jgi:xanthine dehydrogenase small subunit
VGLAGLRVNDTAAIRFLLDGEVHVVGDVPPTTTVLQYLRDDARRGGTKEGCAEGDCGACTVVLAELVDGELRYRATNACLRFLPTLDGRALITVESLKFLNGGRLHPVQQAMVACHGSQCGFCTPGFVMSLFALYQTNAEPGDAEIRHALAGNLCRCTGYRPILAAARSMLAVDRQNASAWEQRLKQQLAAIRVTGEKILESSAGRYVAPSTTNELAARLAAAPESTILAGGTDVGLRVTKQHRELPEIVYLGNVQELGRIDHTDECLDIGASVSLTDAFAALLDEHPDLDEIVRRFASPPICNNGTLCGNLANASPVGDSMPALISLGASVVLRRGDRTRTLALEDLYLGDRGATLAPGEFIASVRVPRRREGRSFRSYKISKRFEQDISAVCLGICVERANGRVAAARVAFGGMAPVPKRAEHCERALTGADWKPASMEEAVEALARDFQPISDVRASGAYRLRVAGNLLRRFFAEIDRPDRAATVWNYSGDRA